MYPMRIIRQCREAEEQMLGCHKFAGEVWFFGEAITAARWERRGGTGEENQVSFFHYCGGGGGGGAGGGGIDVPVKRDKGLPVPTDYACDFFLEDCVCVGFDGGIEC